MSVKFNESFLKKLEYLYIVSKKVFAGQIRAERRSKKTGQGVEFADHRNYSLGDDLRYLDWSVYGRLDKLLLRLFEEEEDLHIYLLVDASRSMAANGKFDYACEVAAALAYVGLAKLDRVSILPFSSELKSRLPPARGKGNIFKVFDFLSGLEPSGVTSLEASIEAFVHRTKRRGVVIVLSDFYDPAGFQGGLDLLRYHRFDATVIQLYSDKEAHPELRGDVELIDAETGESREVTLSDRVLKAYAREHEKFGQELASFCAGRGLPYYRANISVPFDELILRIFRAGGFLQ